MGEMEVPADALYGASTQRAVLNFPISGPALAAPVHPGARADQAGGRRDERGPRACSTPRRRRRRSPPRPREVADGGHDDQFPIDIYQTGSGTSTNTNMNEVVAHLASARLGGGRKVHPNDDVNKLPELERHDPDGAPAVGGDRDRGGAAPGPRSTLQTALAAKARRVLAGRQDRPDPPPGRDADPAGPGVPRATPARSRSRSGGRGPPRTSC